MNQGLHTLVATTAFVLVALLCPVAAQEKRGKSPFAGTYSGIWTFKATDPRFVDQQGKATWSIDTKGKLKAKAFNESLGKNNTPEGSVNEEGHVQYVSAYVGDQTFIVKGTITKTEKGHLKGTLTQYSGKDRIIGIIKIDLSPE